MSTYFPCCFEVDTHKHHDITGSDSVGWLYVKAKNVAAKITSNLGQISRPHSLFWAWF